MKKILIGIICLMLIGCASPKNMVKPDGTAVNEKLAHAIDILRNSKAAYNMIFRILAIAKMNGEISQAEWDVAAKVGREFTQAYDVAGQLVLQWYEDDAMPAVIDVSDVLERIFRLAQDMGVIKPEISILIEGFLEVIHELSVIR